MIEIDSQVRKWGNSFGLVLPKRIIDSENIREGSELRVILQPKKKMTVKDLMEFAKKHPLKFKSKTEDALKKVDRDLWSEEF